MIIIIHFENCQSGRRPNSILVSPNEVILGFNIKGELKIETDQSSFFMKIEPK